MISSQQPYNQYEYEQPPSSIEIILNNIIKAVICIFLIVVGFFLIVLLVSTLNTQTGIEFTTYTREFDILNPTFSQAIFTSNPHLSSIVLTAYNSSNTSYGGVPSTDWVYDSQKTSITINAGALAWDITALNVHAETDYSEPPTESALTAWAVAIVVCAICGVFGIIAYSKWR